MRAVTHAHPPAPAVFQRGAGMRMKARRVCGITVWGGDNPHQLKYSFRQYAGPDLH